MPHKGSRAEIFELIELGEDEMHVQYALDDTDARVERDEIDDEGRERPAACLVERHDEHHGKRRGEQRIHHIGHAADTLPPDGDGRTHGDDAGELHDTGPFGYLLGGEPHETRGRDHVGERQEQRIAIEVDLEQWIAAARLRVAGELREQRVGQKQHLK